MARARTKVPQGVSQGDVGGTAQESSSARPVPLGRPLAEGPKIVHGISASNNSELKRYAELAFRTRSLRYYYNALGTPIWPISSHLLNIFPTPVCSKTHKI